MFSAVSAVHCSAKVHLVKEHLHRDGRRLERHCFGKEKGPDLFCRAIRNEVEWSRQEVLRLEEDKELLEQEASRPTTEKHLSMDVKDVRKEDRILLKWEVSRPKEEVVELQEQLE